MSEKVAVILAGGKGTRLKPYTIALPKPLVPVGDKPILEIILLQLKQYGFTRIIITVNHKADLIETYFGDGSKWGIQIEYSFEDIPLGTMGPLKNILNLPDHFLVMNGDILSDINYAQLLERHIAENRLFTISSYKRIQYVDYGVLRLNDNILCGFEEKPQLSYDVSMGVYVSSKKILDEIPDNTFFGFDHLMYQLLKEKKSVHVENYEGYWMDIGRPEDYQQAVEDIENGKFAY